MESIDISIYDKAITLNDYRKAKYLDIDKKTNELISQGFTYQGLIFSLSTYAQTNLTNLSINSATITPIDWNTIDDSATYTIINQADAQAFYGAAMTRVITERQAGDVFKNQVRACTTIEEIKSIIDNR